jgi:cytochrome c
MNLKSYRSGRLFVKLMAVASLIFVGSAYAAPTGDPGTGSDVFASECSDCHSVKPGKNKKGPSLFGIVDRKSATISDFAYSDDMRSLNAVWTVDKLDAYIAKPKAVVPGGKMKYDGLASEKARADLLSFLATQK